MILYTSCRFIAKGLRSEAVYWNNIYVNLGILAVEEAKRLTNNPMAIFQRFRKSSLDASTQTDPLGKWGAAIPHICHYR